MGTIRSMLLWVIYATGLMRLWRFWHRHDIIILMAHGVTDEEEALSWKPLRSQLSARQLEKYLDTLTRYYRFISLDDAVDMIQGRRPLQKYCMVLTFDDGYRNNLTHALPILRRYRVPATLFVSTGHIDSRYPFWFDRLDYALQQAALDGRELRINGQAIRFTGAERRALADGYSKLRTAAKGMQDDAKMRAELDALAATLESESGRALQVDAQGDDWSALLTWDEIRQSSGEVVYGSHTVDHVRLPLIAADDARDQLRRSKQAVEKHTGAPCKHLCYPDGSYSPAVMDMARECGYASAVTTAEGANRVGDDVLALRRVNLLWRCSTPDLLARVSGLSALLAGLRRRP